MDAKSKPVATPARTSVTVPAVPSQTKSGMNVQPKMTVSTVPKVGASVPAQPTGPTVPKVGARIPTQPTGPTVSKVGASVPTQPTGPSVPNGAESLVAKAAPPTSSSTKSTPVKSPDLKRSKTGGDLGVVVAKNLTSDFDNAVNVGGVEIAATEAHVP